MDGESMIEEQVSIKRLYCMRIPHSTAWPSLIEDLALVSRMHRYVDSRLIRRSTLSFHGIYYDSS